ncbi:MAG: DivIVA domain-containing protein [Flaviflexus sp.]|uniref:DivIVA domain-containing protein n=1 Tax=Flaviflexus sp. TaxID=1969482 RepID=UPI00352BF37A
MALLTEEDVVNKTFTESRYREEGYNQDEVDDFLDEVAETIKQLTEERDSLRDQLAQSKARVGELESGDGQQAAPAAAAAPVTTANETGDLSGPAAGVLALAQQLHDKYVNEGREEGDRILSEANAESARLIKEAEDQHNRTLAQLEQERGLMERKISELRDFERDYRSRMKSYLESLLSNVENGQTGAGNI